MDNYITSGEPITLMLDIFNFSKMTVNKSYMNMIL